MDKVAVADIWRHKKTGNLYELLSHVVDCTNSRDGTRAVVYCGLVNPSVPQYVREWTEFQEKFERVAHSARPSQPSND